MKLSDMSVKVDRLFNMTKGGGGGGRMKILRLEA